MSNELNRSVRIIFEKKFELEISPINLNFLKKYLIDMEIRNLSKKTIYNYQRDLLQWFSYLNKEQFNLNVKDVTENDIEEFLYFCKQEGNNIERLRRRTAVVSSFYKFMRKKKEITENPCEFITRPKKGLPIVTQTFLTFEQYDSMKKKLEEHGDIQLYVYAMISIDTMARVNAISNIKWKQIDLEGRMIDDVLEKENKIVTLYFSEESKILLEKLKKYRKENDIDDNGYLFCSRAFIKLSPKISAITLFSWAKKIGELINVPTLHPHDFRHSGSQLRKLRGMKIEDISALLNHSGLDVTRKHYLKQDKTEMREKMDKFKL
jgi:site-specific recombinase XerD